MVCDTRTLNWYAFCHRENAELFLKELKTTGYFCELDCEINPHELEALVALSTTKDRGVILLDSPIGRMVVRERKKVG